MLYEQCPGVKNTKNSTWARQYLTEIEFSIPHLLASGLQLYNLTTVQIGLMWTVGKKGKTDL